MHLKSIAVVFMLMVISTGCSVVKTVDVIGTDNSEGIVQLGYSYGLFEKPKAQWDQALNKASAQCKSMGYLSAKTPAVNQPSRLCLENGQSGGCIKYADALNYECNLSPEAARQRQLKKEKKIADDAEAAQQLQLQKEKQIADYAKEYPYVATFTCSFGNSTIIFAACLESQNRTKTELELTNGDDYGLYNILDYQKIGRETDEGINVPLRARFKIKIQNANESAKLTLTIKNIVTGEQTFIKSVGQWNSIFVGN